MNILDEFRQHPARVLDRLADGELADDDRSLLLASLDDQPGAWRDCALAFLEAQQFRHEFGAMARERALPRVAVPEKAVAQSRDGAKWLALSHICPPDCDAEALHREVAADFPGPVTVGADLMTLDIARREVHHGSEVTHLDS